MSRIPISVQYMVLSALFFALMSGCVKSASLKGIPVLEILAARALISSVLSYVDIRRKNISPWGNNKPLLIARGVVGTIALMCVFYAVTTLPLAEATLLQYLYPIFTSILAFFFLKEKIQNSTLACIALSIIGLIVMVQPDFIFHRFIESAAPLPMLGVIAALIGALGTGVAYVFVRKLSTTEDPSVIIFYFPFIALPVSLLLIGNSFVMPNGITWILLLLVGIFTQIAQFFLTLAIKSEKASKATAYSYIQVVFSALIGWLAFSEIPTIATCTGALFIIGGAAVNIWLPLKDNENSN